jgi:hypothetical protein
VRRFEIENVQPVTASSGSAVAIIIDHDLGFVMWLGEVFTELGFQAIPALNCRQALALAERAELPISVLVVNPQLPGAPRMVETLMAENPGVQVILIGNPAAHPEPSVTRPMLERPSPWEPISRLDWVARVRKILGHSP